MATTTSSSEMEGLSSSSMNVGVAIGTPLTDLMMTDEIQAGSPPSYQICKVIYEYHPLGAKMVEKPIKIAMSQPRDISIQMGPEERCREQYLRTWKALHADAHIFNFACTTRTYGIAALAVLVNGENSNKPIDFKEIAKPNLDITFNVFDPLNTAGSLVGDLRPNSMEFMKFNDITVNGQVYHRSRTCVMLNERPIFLGYTSSAFGYSGRSVYQRALLPLKTFIQTMITDDMITRKCGLIVAMMKTAGAIVTRLMQRVAGIKRMFLKQGQTGQVLSIDVDESIESLDLTNLEAPAKFARDNCIQNCASAADMPAIMLNEESFAEGFGEGTEDAKKVVQYIEFVREWMQPAYEFMDKITQYRAWTPEFFEIIKEEFPEDYGDKTFDQAFYEWCNSFATQWPSLLKEPESELVKVDEVRLQAVITIFEAMFGKLDPDNQAALTLWVCDNFNELKMMFGSPLLIDAEKLSAHLAEMRKTQDEAADAALEPKPKMASVKDSSDTRETTRQNIARMSELISRLPQRVGSVNQRARAA